MKKYLYPITFGVMLTIFTVYILLNTFVLEQVYDAPRLPEEPLFGNETQAETAETDNSENAEESPAEPEIISTDTHYKDENIEIKISQHRREDTDIYVADVRLSSVEYLKTAFAKGTFGKNITENTSDIAIANNAIFAVNGDFYGSQESGYVLKNGVLYRDEPLKKQEDLVIYPDGRFEFILESKVTAQSLFEKGAYQVLAFGPSLVQSGGKTDSTNAPRGAIKKDNPRTAIGMINRGHYVFAVCDGRTDASKGLTTNELAEFMIELGARAAYNLDGGGSATMYFNGRVVNKPTFNGNEFVERKVSDIVYVGY